MCWFGEFMKNKKVFSKGVSSSIATKIRSFWATHPFLKRAEGQAAVTDALFFLTIISVVSVLLFTSAMSYGKGLMESSTEYYENTFTVSALKTLYAVAVPLEPDKYDILDSNYNDNLFTVLKKDYFISSVNAAADPAQEAMLDINTQKKLMESLKKIMAPLDKSKNYLFYINIPEDVSGKQKMIFVGLVTFRDKYDSYTGPNPKTTYLCGPNPGKPSTLALDDIQLYLKKHSLGQRFAEGRLSLLVKSGVDDKLIIAHTGLISWTASPDFDPNDNPYDEKIGELLNERCCKYVDVSDAIDCSSVSQPD